MLITLNPLLHQIVFDDKQILEISRPPQNQTSNLLVWAALQAFRPAPGPAYMDGTHLLNEAGVDDAA